uniref:Uncharacterized protein n=1 Tax=Coccolithus braarudii TaxID=221442 RepID=A0A7S0Q996_9EUKA|mmetsp:Transcript_49453/g.105593  ORF Transcript_49453/g.105593 Transcript_49453/m.105593 type:complete len:222 (+) Transcript_49453:41-706(+)
MLFCLLSLGSPNAGTAPPLTITNGIDGDVFFNITVGTPGTCTCEAPACVSGGAIGETLLKGQSKGFHAAANCYYYAVGGGIVAKDGRTCRTWRADFNSCAVYGGHTDGECSRISGEDCHVSGTASTLIATIDSTCDTIPYAQCTASSKCCGANVCLPSKPGSSYLMCTPTNSSAAMVGTDCTISRFPGLCCTSLSSKSQCQAATGCHWSPLGACYLDEVRR